MNLVDVISTAFDKLKRSTVKVRRYGNSDIQDCISAGDYGVDSNPPKGMKALYAQTPGSGDNFIIGYLNVNKLADVGEIRTFSTDSDGNLQTYIWLTNDGKIKLGGNIDNAMRFKPSKQAIDDLNSFLNIELAKIATGISAGGGTYTPGTANIDISAAKIDTVLTP